MTHSFKKKYAAILSLLIFLSITSQVYARYDTLSQPNFTVPCQQVFDDSICCEPTCCTPCGDWIVNADVLCWRTLQNALECGCGPDMKNNWDLGYRIGLEYDMACSCLEINTYWTHFHNNYKHNSQEDNFANWNLRYDTIDILIGYEALSNFCFSYIPFIGLRGARIDERLRAHFNNCSCHGIDLTSVTDKNHKQKFCGIGPEIGIGADYILGCGISLFGDVGVGMLYGNFKINVHDFETISDATDDSACCVNKSTQACQAFVDVALGIQFEYCFCNNLELITRLGLEHHRYFNQNRIGDYGDLIFDGAFLSFGLVF